MVSSEFYSDFRDLPDNEVREWFRSTLESPSGLEFKHAEAWRRWLAEFVLDYYRDKRLVSVTDQCRYIAFALRYVAAVESAMSGPYPIQQVRQIMETRPDVAARLLFGDSLTRRSALANAFDPAAQVSMIPLEPHQEAALDSFTQRFAERVNDHNPTFDSSTVAKWSRDPIPELEHAVLEYFKPVRRMARDGTIQRLTVSRPAQSGLSERATLAALVEQFESGPLLLHYAFALHILNDYDRRMQNEDRNFRAQGRVVFAICAFVIGVVTLLLLPLWVELSEWQAAVQGIMVFVGSSLTVILTVLAVIQIRLRTVASTDHITRTRSDIQTLQQLID